MGTYQNLQPKDRLAFRKKREICRKIGALADEFDLWLKRSMPKADLEKHHTQIRAITTHLDQWNRQVLKILRENLTSDSEQFLASIQNAERLMLSEHRIWEFFRSKLAQRNEPEFSRYLKVADEFAWACYKTVQETVYPDPVHALRKEPPLVFFNGGTSPFSISRGKTFEPEDVPGEALSEREIEIVNKLPIPVVGIPWNQIKHLPDALVIGHEVGHIIEDDFGLTERLRTLLGEAITGAQAEPRSLAWEAWLGEVFADIYGCLSAGPAFAGTLIDFLARNFEDISFEHKQESNWGLYPTTYLRGRIILETLNQLGFVKEASDYEALWKTFSSAMDPGFSKDVPAIVRKLLNGKLIKSAGSAVEDKSLTDVFSFEIEKQNEVVKTVGELRADMAPVSEDPRVLIASVRAAYENDPKEFLRKNYAETVLDRFKDVILPGIRAGEMELTAEQLETKVKAYESSAEQMIRVFLESKVVRDEEK